MRHPSDRDLVLHALGPEEAPDLQIHLEQCLDCKQRLDSFLQSLEAAGKHEVPTLSHEEKEDVFATAWRSSRRPEPRSFSPLWRWILQPAALFSCGLLAGYLAFTAQPPVNSPSMKAPVEVVHVSGPSVNPVAPLAGTPIPTELASRPVITPAPDVQSGEDFWQMAGLRNVKLTPTVRYEDGKLVNGARLEGETLNGAMVVMAF